MHSRNVYCIRKHAANRLLIAANTAIQSQNGPGWISGQVFQRAHQCDLLHPAKYLSKYTTRSPVGRGWHCKPSLGRNAKGFNLTHLSSTENILKNYTLRLSLQRFSKHSKKFWEEISPEKSETIFLGQDPVSVISEFRREAHENCALLGHYAACSGSFLPTFRDNLLVRIFRGQGPVICQIIVDNKCLQRGKYFKYLGRKISYENEKDVQKIIKIC